MVHKRQSPFKILGIAFVLTVSSWLVSLAGVELGRQFVPAGDGYPQPPQVQTDLFRFDSVYYLAIAEQGYAYNGDPSSSPNIVFAPLFPLVVEGVANLTGASALNTGFVLNSIFLFLAFAFAYTWLSELISGGAAFVVLLAMGSAAGSYALHAFYSESLTFLLLSLCLYCQQRRWGMELALTCASLGASRLAMLPFVAVFSALFIAQAWVERASVAAILRNTLYALMCWLGVAAYLVYIAVTFGEPIALFTSIQNSSWGLFHQEISWPSLIFGGYLFDYWGAALDKGLATWTDIKTLNLLWISLGLLTCVYLLLRWRAQALTFLFIAYFAFIYWSGAGSDFLISSHRFLLLMLPIFIMFAEAHRALSRRSQIAAWTVSLSLLLINLGYGLLHAAYFNQGVWYYF